MSIPPAVTSQSIGLVLTGLLDGIGRDRQNACSVVATLPEVQLALGKAREGDIDGFHFALMYPWDELIEGLLAREFPASWEVRFLFKESAFIERHFERVIIDAEGSACCADKSTTVMRSLLMHLTTGREIAFDRAQAYTYHLPRLVFAEHAEIVEFFYALAHLHAGRPQKFFVCYAALEARRRGPPSPDAEASTPSTPSYNGTDSK